MTSSTRDKAAHAAEETVDDAAAKAHKARKRVRAAGSRAADKLERSAHATLHASEEYSGAAAHYVRKHPLMATAIAAGAGMIAACLVFKRQ